MLAGQKRVGGGEIGGVKTKAIYWWIYTQYIALVKTAGCHWSAEPNQFCFDLKVCCKMAFHYFWLHNFKYNTNRQSRISSPFS